MKKIAVLILTVSFMLSGCAELQQVAAQLPNGVLTMLILQQALKKRWIKV